MKRVLLTLLFSFLLLPACKETSLIKDIAYKSHENALKNNQMSPFLGHWASTGIYCDSGHDKGSLVYGVPDEAKVQLDISTSVMKITVPMVSGKCEAIEYSDIVKHTITNHANDNSWQEGELELRYAKTECSSGCDGSLCKADVAKDDQKLTIRYRTTSKESDFRVRLEDTDSMAVYYGSSCQQPSLVFKR
ncbi:MAG: hypothetical protein AB7F43_08765 [Bacteriovoracia bacterium]